MIVYKICQRLSKNRNAKCNHNKSEPVDISITDSLLTQCPFKSSRNTKKDIHAENYTSTRQMPSVDPAVAA